MDEILPGLWLGDQDASNDEEMLLNIGIRHVITLREEESRDELSKNIYNEKIKRTHFWIDDFEQELIDRFFPLTNALITKILQSGEKILIHCHAGVSRSATIVAQYLVHTGCCKNGPLAIDFIRTKREIDPNPGFRTQLERYQSWANFKPIHIEKLSLILSAFCSTF